MSQAVHASGEGTLRLSVIIPTYNRAPVLDKCLAALAHQTVPAGEFEVIVADDGSSDETRATASHWAAVNSHFRYTHQPNSGANAARNRALAAARGEIVLLINDDVLATPQMLAEHLAAHDRYPAIHLACLGRVTASPSLPWTRLTWLHLDRAFDGLQEDAELDWRAFFTCNVSLKKRLAAAAGGFEEGIRYHEDLEFSERLSRHGLRIIYRPRALGYHDHFLTEEEFLRTAKREATALAVWARKAPHLHSVLGELGFEPGLPAARRIGHRALGLAINGTTIPFWMWTARRCPERVAHKVYGKVYQAVRGTALRTELRRAQFSESA